MTVSKVSTRHWWCNTISELIAKGSTSNVRVGDQAWEVDTNTLHRCKSVDTDDDGSTVVGTSQWESYPKGPDPGTEAGQVVYWDGVDYVPLANGSSGEVLTSNGASAPSWDPAGSIDDGTVDNAMMVWDDGNTAWEERTSLTYDEPARMVRVAWANLSGPPSGYEVTRDHGSGEVKRAFFGLAGNEDAAMRQFDTSGNLEATWQYDFSLQRWECQAGGSGTDVMRVSLGQFYTNGRVLHGALPRNTTLASGDNDDVAQPATAFYLWRLTPNASGSAITGIATLPLAAGDGQQIIVANVDATVSITLKHDNASSTAANRILCPNNTDLTIPPNGSRMLYYDGSSNRWRVLGAVA